MAAHYAYFACFQNLYRVKIKIPSSPSSCKEEVKLELVASDLPYFMALFNHGHIMYAVGGVDVFAETAEAGPSYSRKRLIFDFDPSRFPQLPIENSDSLDKPVDFQSMECPRVIRGDDDRIYLLSKNHSCFKPVLEGQFCFQSFDFVKDCFETLPPPPLAPDHALDLDRTLDRFFALGHFVLRGYLYLLISNPLSSKYPKSAFTFNIKSSKWEETSLLAQFEEKEIPPPFGHNGDIGLSDEFSENIRILVALCYTELYAYCVKIHAEGVLEFISYRAIKEIQCVGEDEDGLKCDVTQLADLGGGKFCVVTGSRAIDVLIYVFEINFDLEYRIQSSQSRVGASSGILYYKKFQPGCNIQSFCIVSAPPAIEDQDRVESTTKRERSGDETVHEAKFLRSL